ncbi:hypothetical protein E2C01_028290 [Portunus trituberculatus]|uniref:Uncharacterized protein n=1 Tax=Portunus trituberculatus TaxID=210409 RepID=A0A5B7ENN3_PORTR|nr:hypothetical protein [Portunus trituberculatus]
MLRSASRTRSTHGAATRPPITTITTSSPAAIQHSLQGAETEQTWQYKQAQLNVHNLVDIKSTVTKKKCLKGQRK